MSTPTPRFDNDDQAAQHWLTLLRDGDDDQKILAREQLAGIFERRGMLEEATDLLEANGRAGVRTRELFARLASLYHQVGRHDDAIAASAEAALLAKPPAPVAPAADVPPAPVRRTRSTIRLVGLGCLGCGGLAVLGFIALAVIGSQLPKPQGTPTTVAVQPTIAPAAALPAETPEPTAAPIAPTVPAKVAAPKPESKPTATARPAALTIVFTGRFDPSTLRVGQKLVIELGIENKSETTIEGFRIFTRGPWDKYTVANVLPGGRFESGMLGYNAYSNLAVPAGQKRFINIVAYPNEPGNHDFSFIPNSETGALKDEKGEAIVIGGKVNVIR